LSVNHARGSGRRDFTIGGTEKWDGGYGK